MAYKQKSYRDAWGYVQELDDHSRRMEDTHTDIKRMVAKDESTGTFENLGDLLKEQVKFQGQTLDRFGRLETKVALLLDRVKLLLWIGSVLFVAAVGVLVKGK